MQCTKFFHKHQHVRSHHSLSITPHGTLIPFLFPHSLITPNRRQLFTWSAAAAAFSVPCLCCPPFPAGAAPLLTTTRTTPTPIKEQWSYGGPEGVSHWPNAFCSTGKSQSPIDIPLPTRTPTTTTTAEATSSLRPSYPPASSSTPKPQLTVINNGHGSPQINFPSLNPNDRYLLHVGDATYYLAQLHFHTPSEHTLDSQHSAIECHLVHKEVTTGGLAVVAVLMKVGPRGNPVLEAALRTAPAIATNGSGTARPIVLPTNSLYTLIPKEKKHSSSYALYQGSLTTPPCTEKVRWFVLLDHHPEVTAQQVIALMEFGSGGKTLGQNQRPEQQRNNREILYH